MLSKDKINLTLPKRLKSCITIIIIFFIIIFFIGILIPKLFISDGIENFEGEEKEFAEHALWQAHVFGNFIQKLPRLRIRIIHIKKIGEGDCSITNKDYMNLPALKSKYVAKVGCYTLFCIPLEYLNVYCEGSVNSIWSIW